MCHDLAAQNALLKNQLAAVVKALRCGRAAAQAELQALRQKVRALAEFMLMVAGLPAILIQSGVALPSCR